MSTDLFEAIKTRDMAKKLLFYQRYGVEEYYIYNPDTLELTGFIRSDSWLEEIEEINGWVSPRLGVRFVLTPETLEIYRPNGQKFLTSLELDQLQEQEHQRAEQERQEKEAALSDLERERQRYQDMLRRLIARGIDPEQL